MADHKTLLLKYIHHVETMEGVDFLDDHDRTDILADDAFFTDEEWSWLQRLREESIAQYRTLDRRG